jgi:hypothetical protein
MILLYLLYYFIYELILMLLLVLLLLFRSHLLILYNLHLPLNIWSFTLCFIFIVFTPSIRWLLFLEGLRIGFLTISIIRAFLIIIVLICLILHSFAVQNAFHWYWWYSLNFLIFRIIIHIFFNNDKLFFSNFIYTNFLLIKYRESFFYLKVIFKIEESFISWLIEIFLVLLIIFTIEITQKTCY